MKLDKELGILTIGNNSFEVDQSDTNVYCDIELPILTNMSFKISEIIEDVIFRTHSVDGFGTYLFYELTFFKDSIEKDFVVFSLVCNQPNKYWEGQWGLSTLLATLADVVKDSEELIIGYDCLRLEDDWKYLDVSFTIEKDFSFNEVITKYVDSLKQMVKRTELILSGVVWKIEYEKNEKLFCTEIIFPLLRKMEFFDVRYNHGVKEYGKDFTFSEQTKFGNLRHYALQAKAGSLSGKVNSDIDIIIGQLNDAFSMPYHEISANEKRYISTFIIAISGSFTDNAKDKIAQKIPPHFRGNVYLLDRDKIMELIEKFWN